MHTTARRLDEGQPLRDAMAHARMGLQELAKRTKGIDEFGKGVSFQLCAFLATDKLYARETTTIRTAELIEAALSVPAGSLFEQVDLFARSDPQPVWEAL